jgi:hypothetical protein
MPATDPDRHIDLAHHDRAAVTHVARVTLDQIGALIAGGSKPGGVVENPTIAAVGGIPDHIAGTLRMGVDPVVYRYLRL